MTHADKPNFGRRDFLRACGLAWMSLGLDFIRHATSGRPEDTLQEIEQPPVCPDTFDSFVVAAHNQEAFAAITAVAEKPFLTYNPLFIHGPAGMGKTHLLRAFGQHLAASKPQCRVLYLPATRFAYLVDKAMVGDGAAARFREHFYQADVILLDDVHHLTDETACDLTSPDGPHRIAGVAAQMALHELFDAMYDTASKLFVFTAACEPDAMPHLSRHLVQRFQWGVVSQIRMPTAGWPFPRGGALPT